MNFTRILGLVKAKLPLNITNVEWYNPQLLINTAECGFVVVSSWRVINKGSLVYGSFTQDVDERLLSINRLDIIDITPQSRSLSCDFSLSLSDGSIVEVFSSDCLEPWSVVIDGMQHFADPYDSEWTS
jgi:hypothetical protein